MTKILLIETALEYMKQAGIDPVTWNVKKKRYLNCWR